MKIGLTGSIGAGKSLVFEYIKDIFKDEATYIDADLITTEMYQKKEVLDTLKSMFGTNDRKKIGEIVFKDEGKLKDLNTYMHKSIIEEIKKRMEESDKAYIVVDIPLLYELKLENLFDEVIVVYADKETQINRIILRNGLNREEARRRVDSQMSIEEKKEKTKFVIDNMSDKDHLYKLTKEVVFKLIGGKNAD